MEPKDELVFNEGDVLRFPCGECDRELLCDPDGLELRAKRSVGLSVGALRG